MGRPRQTNRSLAGQEADIAFLEEMIALVRQDGHSLSLSARKKLIDAIEKFRSATDSDRNLPLVTGNGQSI